MTDTLAIVRCLEAAGVASKTAEAQTEIIQKFIQPQQDSLVSKGDLRSRLAALERCLYGVQFAVADLLFAAVKPL